MDENTKELLSFSPQYLRARIAELEAKLAEARAEIGRLLDRLTLEQLIERAEESIDAIPDDAAREEEE